MKEPKILKICSFAKINLCFSNMFLLKYFEWLKQFRKWVFNYTAEECQNKNSRKKDMWDKIHYQNKIIMNT